MKKINLENKINKYYVIIGSVCIALVLVVLILSIKENTKQYLVENGTLEYTEMVTGYIIKDEAVISKEKSKILVPVIAEGSRVAKNDIIATYKGEEYKNYETTLSQMDKEILERMKYLPPVYSSEVNAIEHTIYTLVKESIGQTSYSKMQDYKQKVNNNINKRANIIGELSPDGAEIKEMLEERNNYEQQAKKSNDNILATMPGIVVYSADGIEDKLDYNIITNINYDTIKNTINELCVSDNTKIKIVNNYEAYIVMKVDLKNAEYIKEGQDYKLRLIEQDGYELLGELIKATPLEDGVEVYFKITNGIENIVNLREAEIEIVWDYSSGLVVPFKAINKYDNIDAYYVTAIKYATYEKIPVQVRIQSKNYALVKNYTEEELKTLELVCDYKLKLYDRIIVENKK